MKRILAAVALAALALVACRSNDGGPVGATAAGGGTVTAVPGSIGAVPSGVEHESGSGSARRVDLVVGQVRTFRLARSGVGSFDPVTASRPGVVRIVQSGGYPADTDLVATVTAVKAGRTVLRSQTDLYCFHTSPACLPPITGWSATVTVRPNR